MFPESEFNLQAAREALGTANEAVNRLQNELSTAQQAKELAQQKLLQAEAFDEIVREIRGMISSLQETHRQDQLAKFTQLLGPDPRSWRNSNLANFEPQEFGLWLEGRLLVDTVFLTERLKHLRKTSSQPITLTSETGSKQETLAEFARLLLNCVEVDPDWPPLEVVASSSRLLPEVEIRFKDRDFR